VVHVIQTRSQTIRISRGIGENIVAKGTGNDIPTDPNAGLGPEDRDHVLIEADAGNGVIAVPLDKYTDTILNRYVDITA